MKRRDENESRGWRGSSIDARSSVHTSGRACAMRWNRVEAKVKWSSVMVWRDKRKTSDVESSVYYPLLWFSLRAYFIYFYFSLSLSLFFTCKRTRTENGYDRSRSFCFFPFDSTRPPGGFRFISRLSIYIWFILAVAHRSPRVDASDYRDDRWKVTCETIVR